MKSVYSLLLGMLTAGLLYFQVFTACDDNSPASNNDPVDVEKINQSAQKIEDAFATGNIEQVKAVMSGDALRNYSDEFSALTSEKLKKFASDFKQRRLDDYNNIYAEYSFPWGNTRYTVQLSLQNDGTYKLMTF